MTRDGAPEKQVTGVNDSWRGAATLESIGSWSRGRCVRLDTQRRATSRTCCADPRGDRAQPWNKYHFSDGYSVAHRMTVSLLAPRTSVGSTRGLFARLCRYKSALWRRSSGLPESDWFAASAHSPKHVVRIELRTRGPHDDQQ